MSRSVSHIFKRFFLVKRQLLKNKYNRALPVNELFTDRWEKASYLGFGKGSSIYDSSCVFGDVKVGNDTWVGPNTILDGSGGLSIGSNCSISAGVHIYSHSTVLWAVSDGKESYEYGRVSIGNCCFIGPQSMIQMGVSIGKHCIVAANSFVNKDVPDFTVVGGSPAKVIGRIVISNGKPEIQYNK